MQTFIAACCLLRTNNDAINLALAVGWLTSAVLCVWVSKGRRGRALLMICVSAVLAQKALAVLAMSLSCLFGGECM